MPKSVAIFLLTLSVACLAFVAGRFSMRTSERPVVQSPRAKSAGNPVAPAAEISTTATSGTTNDAADTGVPVALQRLHAAVTSIAADEERLRLLNEWAERDPAGALEFALKNLKADRRAQATASILQIWGKNHPAEAWGWVAMNAPEATHHFDTLLEVFGKNNPAAAARYAMEYARGHPSKALEVHLAAMLGMTYNGNYTAARQLVDANPMLTPEVRGNLHNFIAGQWARYQPEQAAAWVLSLPAGPLRDQAFIGLGESWSDNDPGATAAFALGLPEGDSRKLALRQSIAKWVMADAEAARAWVIKSNQHEDFDQAVATITTDHRLLNRDPLHALEWANTIFDEGMRFQSVSVVIANIYPRDPATAVQQIRNLPDLTDAQRTQLLNQFPPKD